MALVFYGHVWPYWLVPNTAVLLQNKLIYSFHMPLFFIMTGFFAKDNMEEFGLFIKNKIFTRILPVIVFNGLLIIFKITIDIVSHNFHVEYYLEGITSLIKGNPIINIPTWFLICLFTTEMIHFCVSRKITTQKSRLISAIVFYILGILVTWKIDLLSRITVIPPNFWYIHEALVAYSFFLMGFILNKSRVLELITQTSVKYFCLILSTIVVLVTFRFNFTVVMMVSSIHGHPIWFLVTALAGSAALIFLSQLTPRNRVLLFFGQNTLVLLGLNGFFRDIFNYRILKAIPPEALVGHYRTFIVYSLITILSLIACVPAILFFNKFFPQLIGRPKERGPILPNLV